MNHTENCQEDWGIRNNTQFMTVLKNQKQYSIHEDWRIRNNTQFVKRRNRVHFSISAKLADSCMKTFLATTMACEYFPSWPTVGIRQLFPESTESPFHPPGHLPGVSILHHPLGWALDQPHLHTVRFGSKIRGYAWRCLVLSLARCQRLSAFGPKPALWSRTMDPRPPHIGPRPIPRSSRLARWVHAYIPLPPSINTTALSFRPQISTVIPLPRPIPGLDQPQILFPCLCSLCFSLSIASPVPT